MGNFLSGGKARLIFRGTWRAASFINSASWHSNRDVSFPQGGRHAF